MKINVTLPSVIYILVSNMLVWIHSILEFILFILLYIIYF